MRFEAFLLFFILSSSMSIILKEFKLIKKSSFTGLVLDSDTILLASETAIFKLDSEFVKVGKVDLSIFEGDLKKCANSNVSSPPISHPSYFLPLSNKLLIICQNQTNQSFRKININNTENSINNNTYKDNHVCLLVNYETYKSFCFMTTTTADKIFIDDSLATLLISQESPMTLSLNLVNKDSMEVPEESFFQYKISSQFLPSQQIVHSFNNQPYLYFFSNQQKSKISSSALPLSALPSSALVVSRLCKEDVSRSLVEIPVGCVIDGVVFRQVLDVVQFQDQFIIAFKSSFPSSQQAICTYRKDEIEIKMDDVVDRCFLDGDGFKESSFFNPVQSHTCTKSKTALNNNSYCGEYNFYHAIFSNEMLKGSHFESGMCSVVDLLVDKNVLFVLCRNATIQRYKLTTSNSTLLLAELTDLTDMIGTQVNQSHTWKLSTGLHQSHLYILKQHSLVSIQKSNCGADKDCSSCSSEPFCGWCLYNNKCSSRYDCQKVSPSNSFAFLPHCCNLVSISPNRLPINYANTAVFNLTVLQHSSSPPQLTCQADCKDMAVETSQVAANVVLVDGGFVASCGPFSYLTNYLINSELIQSSLEVQLKMNEVMLLSADVVLYDCTKLTSCRKCQGGKLPCKWCGHSCVHVQDQLCHFQKDFKCVSIFNTNQIPFLIPTDHATNIELQANHLTSEMLTSGLYCIIDSTHIYPAIVSPLPYVADDVTTINESFGVVDELIDGGDELGDGGNYEIDYIDTKDGKKNKEIIEGVEKGTSGRKKITDVDIGEEIESDVGGGRFVKRMDVKIDDMVVREDDKHVKNKSSNESSKKKKSDEVADNKDDGEADVDNVEDVSKKKINRHSISCQVELKIESIVEAKRMVAVEIAWGEDAKYILPSQKKIKAELYDCGMMGTNCGLCGLIEKIYGCYYCNNHCSHACQTPPSTPFCSNPIILSFSPPGAPLNSVNTTLIIHGQNLAFTPDNLNVVAEKTPCNVTEQAKLIFVPTQMIACELASSKVQKEVQIGYGTKYPAWAARKFIYQNSDVKELQPNRGPRSGKTLVTIHGSRLDFGSNIEVQIENKKSIVKTRNSTTITILTPSSDNNTSLSQNIKIVIDGVEVDTKVLSYNYLPDPYVTKVDPLFSLISGGNFIDFRGENLNAVQRPYVIFYLPNNDNITSKCKVEHRTYLRCATPDLRVYNLHLPASLHYGLVMDGVKSLLRLSSRDDLKAIQYHRLPNIATISNPIKYHNSLNNKLVIQGTDLAVLKEFTDFMINVSDASCTKKTYNDTHIICELPEPEKINFFDDNMKADVMVSLGNYRRKVGVVSYQKHSFYLLFVLAIGIIVSVVLIIAISVCVVCLMKKKKKRMEYENSFLMKPPQKTINTNTSALTATQQPREEKPLLPRTPDNDQSFLANILNNMQGQRLKSVAKNLYISRQHILLGDLLGKGTFTNVYRVTISPNKQYNTKKTLCLKTLNDSTGTTTTTTWVRDCANMSSFKHLNVLTPVAFSIGPNRQPWLLIPYMINGDLRKHVKDRSKTFTARDLLTLAQKVAGGMAYLANFNFVHRRLCCSNCLLDEQLEVKISDFGLSTQLQQQAVDNKYEEVANKWMSLETLENSVFTCKTDVWSYGVLLWELITRGVTPYPDIPLAHLSSFLASGRRLKKPKYCPNNVYTMMGECWQEIPERRPTFTDLVNRLEILLNPPKKREADEEPLYINHYPLTPTPLSPTPLSPSPLSPLSNHSPAPAPPIRMRN